jgi:hypothetical protein
MNFLFSLWKDSKFPAKTPINPRIIEKKQVLQKREKKKVSIFSPPSLFTPNLSTEKRFLSLLL